MEIYNTLILTEEDKKNHKKVVDEFEKYTNPRKNVVYERFKFFSKKQEQDENFDHFLTDLKKPATSCEFELQKDSLIRDIIVLGISDKSLQEKLLTRQDLTLEKAEMERRAWELTKSHVKSVQKERIFEIKQKKTSVFKV